MTREEWDKASATGRRWAIFGSMFGAKTDDVRVIRWYKSGVRVRFPDGRQLTVHPDYLHLKVA